MEIAIGFGFLGVFILVCACILGGQLYGERVARDRFERDAVKAGVAIFDSQTKEFTWLKPGR